MRSILEVTEHNSAGLLTTAEAKAALGITDSLRDDDVDRAVARISAAIYRACNLRTDGVTPPTLLSEALKESFRLDWSWTRGPLQLSRRRVTELVISEAGGAIDPATYDLDRAAAQLWRLDGSGAINYWTAGSVVVEYTAGFIEVPDDLKLAAETWLRTLWRDSYDEPSTISDPMIKVEEIPGVRRIERWVSDMNASAASTTTMVPANVQSVLVDGGYIERWIA
jgi:hypothetical protein